ncbi:MAG: transcriptional regulator [Phenylobacterium sp.]|jgi:transcriptional regulator
MMEVLSPDSPQMAIASDLFKRYPFATLLVSKKRDVMPEIVHLPFLYDHANQCFYAHAAAKNPIVSLIQAGQNQAKLIFNGEHGYVSPAWTEHQRVPTWDYCVVHVAGLLTLVEQADDKVQSMVAQVAAMEGSGANDWQISALNDKLQTQMLKAIKVIKISINSMSYRYKMSQDKHPDGQSAIRAKFAEKGEQAMVARYQALHE